MEVVLIVVGVVALASLVGAVVLLVQRGQWVARGQGAEAALAMERERSLQGERALADAGQELKRLGERLSTAQADVARLMASLEGERTEREADRRDAETRVRDAVEGERRRLSERVTAFEEAKKEYEAERAKTAAALRDQFGALAAEALRKSGGELLTLAEQKWGAERAKTVGEVEKQKGEVQSLVAPIGETLKQTDVKLAEMQKQWAEDRGRLTEQIAQMGVAGEGLRSETRNLVRALSRPEVRGRYGEIQLRRVAELAGMTAFCDFSEQETVADGEGRSRPDMIVKLPNERVIVVDAKTNTMAYVEAANAATPAEQEAHLQRFAGHVAEQVGALSKKEYWSKFDGSPDFVVMFMPGDQFLDAALSRRPELIEDAAKANVLIATPATLIGLLRAVAVGWRERRLAKEAGELLELGRTLHERARIAMEKVAELGGAIEGTVRKYNEFVGSYQSRLEPALKRFEDAGARGAKMLPEVKPVDMQPRLLTGPERA